MAQGFTAITTSLGEAERQKNGKNWTQKDFLEHKNHYNIDSKRTHLNEILVGSNGLNERDLVNKFMIPQMEKINRFQVDKVKQWNDVHSESDPNKPGKMRMQINPKTGKQYGKRSVNKSRMYPVGDYKDKGTRKLPYDVFKNHIEKGNARGKEADSTRYRTGVTQQYVVSWGSSEEWQKDPVRKFLWDGIHSGDSKREQMCKQKFEITYVKPFLKKFQQENPSLPVLQAVVHYDETNPHLQFTALPYVPGKESGGLGSTSYTGALKHDHPDMSKSTIISSFYQAQHEYLREQIATAKPGLVNRQNVQVSMQLGKRPGTHKSYRVDQFSEMKADNDRQLKFIADKKSNLDDREVRVKVLQQKVDVDNAQNQKDKQSLTDARDSVKATAVDTITAVEPDHLVPKNLLSSGDIANPVKSSEGRKQHLSQSAEWLAKTAQKLAQEAVERLKQTRAMLATREESLNDNENSYKQRLTRLRKRENDINKREQAVNEQDERVTTIWNKFKTESAKFGDFIHETVSKLGFSSNIADNLTVDLTAQTKFYKVPIEGGKLTKKTYTGGMWALHAIKENPKIFTPNVVSELVKEKQDDGPDL